MSEMNEVNRYYVYQYIDPRTNLPFYIGKGKGNRYLAHLKETADTVENKRKREHIQQLASLGLEPTIVKFQENLSEDIAYTLEAQLIKKYGRKDFDPNGILTNICLDGRPPTFYGEQHPRYGMPVPRTEEQEQKRRHSLSLAKKGKPSLFKGRSRSDNIRKTASITHRGKVVSETTKQKLRELNTGPNNPNYGTIWITNGTANKKIKNTETVPNGWWNGRTISKGAK